MYFQSSTTCGQKEGPVTGTERWDPPVLSPELGPLSLAGDLTGHSELAGDLCASQVLNLPPCGHHCGTAESLGTQAIQQS